MKTILIDLYKTKNPYNGLGMFSMDFAKELINQIPSNYRLNFLVPASPFNNLLPEAKFYKATFLKRYFPSTNQTFNLWHSLYQSPQFYPNKKTFQIITIHDLNFLLEKEGLKKERYLKNFKKSIARADYIVAISTFTKKILLENVDIKNKPLEIIPVGVKLNTFLNDNLSLNNYPYFFCICEFSFKKNIHSIINMLPYIKNFKLILAGNNKNKYGNYIKDLILKLNLQDRIVLTGIISDEQKYYYYKKCTAFLFPSTIEGFGRPPIEAMLAGKPVFLSTHCSLPEIGGEQAFYFNSFEPKEMADTILNGLNKIAPNLPEFENQSIQYAQKYSWQNCIQSYIKLYNSILN